MSYGTECHRHDAYDINGVAEGHHRPVDVKNHVDGPRADLGQAVARIRELEERGDPDSALDRIAALEADWQAWGSRGPSASYAEWKAEGATDTSSGVDDLRRAARGLREDIRELRAHLDQALARIAGLERLRPTCSRCLDATATRQTASGAACDQCAGDLPDCGEPPRPAEYDPCPRVDGEGRWSEHGPAAMRRFMREHPLASEPTGPGIRCPACDALPGGQHRDECTEHDAGPFRITP